MPGLPNTRVIHLAFQSHHRPVTDGGMPAECVITRPASAGTPTFNEATAQSIHPPAATVYAGKCRITVRPVSPATVVVADRAVSLADYVVAVPADVPQVQTYDLVEVTVNPDDPTLVGAQLTVRETRSGSITWERDLLCDLSQPTTR